MWADYCWSLQRDLSKVVHSRKYYKITFDCVKLEILLTYVLYGRNN